MHQTSGALAVISSDNEALDTKYSITIMLQLYPEAKGESSILSYGKRGNGLQLKQIGTKLVFVIMQRNLKRAAPDALSVDVLKLNMWNAVAVTYDYVDGVAKLYVNANSTGELEVGRRLLGTQGGISLVGAVLFSHNPGRGNFFCGNWG